MILGDSASRITPLRTTSNGWVSATRSLGRGRFDSPTRLGQRLVWLAEIIVHHVKRYGVLAELDFLAESVGQPGEPEPGFLQPRCC